MADSASLFVWMPCERRGAKPNWSAATSETGALRRAALPAEGQPATSQYVPNPVHRYRVPDGPQGSYHLLCFVLTVPLPYGANANSCRSPAIKPPSHALMRVTTPGNCPPKARQEFQ